MSEYPLPLGAIPLPPKVRELIEYVERQRDPQPPRSWHLVIPGRPVTLNRERKGSTHWTKSRVETRTMRTSAYYTALERRLPRGELQTIAITARPHLADRRGQDVGACFPSVKAAIDGLVDAAIVPNDTPRHVRRLTFEPPVLNSDIGDALELILEEIRP